MIKNVLFDLDGTLLVMPSQEAFLNAYFRALVENLTKKGYNGKKIAEGVWAGTKSMIENSSLHTNQEAFWETFVNYMGLGDRKIEEEFEDFYLNDFVKAKETTACNEYSKKIINCLNDKGYKLVLATNPVFPAVATSQRIEWAGLKKEDFLLVTTYENSKRSKPNISYYQEIIDKMGFLPSETMMIGNDVQEDMVAESMGLDTYLVLDNLIDGDNKAEKIEKRGSMRDLYEYVLKMPRL